MPFLFCTNQLESLLSLISRKARVVVVSVVVTKETGEMNAVQESEDHVPSEDEEETPEGLVCPGRESLKDEVETTRGKYCLQAE